MTALHSRARRSIVLAATLLCVNSLATIPARSQQPTRLIAIGDIHGSYDGLITILRRTGLIDERGKWSGGRSVLVQTGDYTDRGTDVRKVMDLLMQLEKDAKAAGGQAIVLAGNHEIMNAMGDLRDVTPEICGTFATAKSENRREEAWKQYERLVEARARVTPTPAAVYTSTREAFLQAHPPGCLEYREAMGPSGSYGRWIRDKDIAVIVGDTLFMHAGLNPARPAPKTLADVNDRVRAEVRRLDNLRKRLSDRRLGLPFFGLQEVVDVAIAELTVATQALAAAKAEGTEPPALDVPLLREAQALLDLATWSLVDPEGPLWFRGYATWAEETTAPQVTGFLDQMKLSRIVVGHTPTTERRIVTRYGGRVVLIDTGMLAATYNGVPSALEIVGGRLKAIYPDGEVELTPAKAARTSLSRGTRSSSRANNPAALATAKLTHLRLRSGGTPGIGRG
jgi:hypothetical protein